jgi:NodT family efflux transporter outer membrane factor (OMF) lipoprotein
MAERRRYLALCGPFLLAGCSFAPAYAPPASPPVPAAFKETGPWVPAEPGRVPVGLHWWEQFGDPVLDGLETRLQADNPSLAAALARYDAARGSLQQARAQLYPHIGVDAQVSDNRQSDNRPTRGNGGGTDVYQADTVEGTAGYELDLWGRVRNSVAAGRAGVQASADDLAAVRLSLETQLADTYIVLRGYDRQIALLTATVADFAKADAMTRRRFAGEIASGIETGQSGTELAEARAQLAEMRDARALAEHALASLAGTPAPAFALDEAAPDMAVPRVPVGVPSTLLQRRPDVAAAERRVYAANREIGVARAAFYPSIGLGGAFGVQNTGLPGLFTAPNILWSVGPGAALSLFDGGARRGRLAVARAQWNEATQDYRLHVLQAFQQVEDNLARLHYLGDELDAERAAETEATRTERLSLNRYEKGAVDYLSVVTAQTTALRVRRAVIDLRTRSLRAVVALIGATGGGWSQG